MGSKTHPHNRPTLKTKTDYSIRILCARLSAVMVCGGVISILFSNLKQRPAFEGIVLITLAGLFMAMAIDFKHIEFAFRKIRILLKS